MDDVKRDAAAVALGRRGGTAGRGASKCRGNSEFYRDLVAKRRDRNAVPERADLFRLIQKMDGGHIYWRIGNRGHSYEGCPSGLTAALRWMVRNQHARHASDWTVQVTDTGRELLSDAGDRK
jgi:hypothetical protein